MISKHYNTEFNTYRVSSSIDAYNFEIETYGLNLTDKGYFEPLSGNERIYNDRKEVYNTHRLFTPVIDVTEKDEIHIGSSTFEVDSVLNHRNHHLEIMLIKRN